MIRICFMLFLWWNTSMMSLAAEQEEQLRIHYEYAGNPISGVEYEVFYVANVTEDHSIELAEMFAECPVELNGLDTEGYRSMASLLKDYVKREHISPIDVGVTDELGEVTFPNTVENLPAGLYLVNTKPYSEGSYIYDTEPVFILLPERDSDKNVITAWPKIERKEKETEKEETLPQTGLLWWPIPVLTAAGIVCIALSKWMKSRK